MARKASICSSPLYYPFPVLQIVVLVELVRGYSSAVSGLRARTQFPSFSATSPLLHHRRHFLSLSTYDSSTSTESKFRPTSLNAFPRFPATASSLTRRAGVISSSGTDSESEGAHEEGNINNQVQQSLSDDMTRDKFSLFVSGDGNGNTAALEKVATLIQSTSDKVHSTKGLTSSEEENIAKDLNETHKVLDDSRSTHSALLDKITKLEKKLFDVNAEWEAKLEKAKTEWREEIQKLRDKFEVHKGKQVVLFIRQLAYSYQYKAASYLSLGKDPTKRYLLTHEQMSNQKSADPSKLRALEELFDPSYEAIDVDLLVKEVRDIGAKYNHPTELADGACVDKPYMEKAIDDALSNKRITEDVAKSAKVLLNVVDKLATDYVYGVAPHDLLKSK